MTTEPQDCETIFSDSTALKQHFSLYLSIDVLETSFLPNGHRVSPPTDISGRAGPIDYTLAQIYVVNNFGSVL